MRWFAVGHSTLVLPSQSPIVTVRVWMYCAVTGLCNTVIPPETASESLVQVTLVAGPPIEIQARVN